MDSSTEVDLSFYFDPVCPFAWMTSKWVRMVAAQREYSVDWRFISLRILNANVDYASHFPENYEDGHTAGLRLLRVCARVRTEHGRPAVGDALRGTRHPAVRHTPRQTCPRRTLGRDNCWSQLLRDAGLPTDLADALDDSALDDEIRTETEEALALTGRDVGTPILHFQPPGGTAFFGPVISRLPSPDDAGRLWDHVVGLAGFRRLRGDQAQPAGTSSAGQFRRRRRIGWHRGGLARRQPPHQEIVCESQLRQVMGYDPAAMDQKLAPSRAADEVLRACTHLGVSAHKRSVGRQAAVVSRGAGHHRGTKDRPTSAPHPTLYLRDGERVVLPASFGGRADHPGWYRNLKTDPKVHIQIRNEHLDLIARDADR